MGGRLIIKAVDPAANKTTAAQSALVEYASTGPFKLWAELRLPYLSRSGTITITFLKSSLDS